MIFWSVGFPAGEILLETWGTLSLVFVRTFFGVSLLLCIWIIFDGYKEVLFSQWYRGIFIGGIGFGFGATFLLYGQKISDPVTPAIAVAMTPVSGMLVEIIFDKRKMNFQIILGILIVLFGGLLASGIIFLPKSLNFGFFYCYLATLFFGWGTQATSKSLPKMSTIGRTTITLIGSVLCMGVLCLGSLFFDKELITIGNYDKYSLFLLFLFSVFSLDKDIGGISTMIELSTIVMSSEVKQVNLFLLKDTATFNLIFDKSKYFNDVVNGNIFAKYITV